LGKDIRLTPWRALIVTGLDRARAEDLAAALVRQGFILDPADRRLAVVACAGAPACPNAARPVQAEALAFAASIPAGRGIVLHVSGCEKGCAHGAAPVTLVAREAGYDVIEGGKAADAPAHRAQSGEAVAMHLARKFGGVV
jgi:precorrin-3B synthase